MRKRLLTSGVVLVLLALVLGVGGCERAKPAPTPTTELEPQAATETPVVTPAMSPEASVTPPSPPEETPTSPPAQATATPSPSGPIPGEGIEYVVVWGDTIELIATRFGVSVEDIVAANNLTDPDVIKVGDVLVIPGASAPAPQPGVHIVRPGETLSSIALMYGTTVDAIVSANGIVDANFIHVGQRLIIPG